MDARDLVTEHYGSADLSGSILRALTEAGVDTEHLAAEQLFAVDQLHVGGAPAVEHLLSRLDVGPGTRVLDVGCGIGGPSRMAALAGAEVTGVDLTPDFVEAATVLTARVGLADRARFVTTSAEELPFDDAAFDAALMVHVGMNVPDKPALFAQVARVLAPGGRFAVFDQTRLAPGEIPYPVPWAPDERSSFVESPEHYVAALESAGLTVEDVEDRTPATMTPPPPGAVSNAVVFGEDFARRLDNLVAATRAGTLGSRLFLARR